MMIHDVIVVSGGSYCVKMMIMGYDGIYHTHRVGPECEVFARRDQICIAD